jgi:hypothetical protein
MQRTTPPRLALARTTLKCLDRRLLVPVAGGRADASRAYASCELQFTGCGAGTDELEA